MSKDDLPTVPRSPRGILRNTAQVRIVRSPELVLKGRGHSQQEVYSMIEQINTASPKVLGFKLSGKLYDEDYQRFMPVLEAAIKEHGKIRIIADLDNFH